MPVSSRSKVLCVAIFVALAAAGLQTMNRRRPWHQGDKWEKFFAVYDRIASEQYGDCKSGVLDQERFGSTQFYACGNPAHRAVFLIHGAAECALMWGDWMVPALRDRYFVVAIDTLCDVGRSRPRNGDTTNCPQGKDEMAAWILDLKSQLGIKAPISLVGYSYGSFVSSQVALARPDAVNKLVLMAPAAVFAPIQPAWLLRALAFESLYTMLPVERLKAMLRNFFHGYMTYNPQSLPLESIIHHWDLTTALNDAGPTELLGTPHPLEEADLKKMGHQNPTLLIIGQQEVVTNPSLAAQAAKEAGIQVKEYENVSHTLDEWPRIDAARVVLEFLDGTMY